MAFTLDSKIGDFLDDPKGIAALAELVQELSTNPLVGVIKGMTLKDLLAFPQARQLGITQDMVKMGLADWPDDQATDADTDIEDATAPKAVCARCGHWRADNVNPSGGLGTCLTRAPASRRPGSCWPWLDAEIRCREFQEVSR